jgi:hypothetical protein
MVIQALRKIIQNFCWILRQPLISKRKLKYFSTTFRANSLLQDGVFSAVRRRWTTKALHQSSFYNYITISTYTRVKHAQPIYILTNLKILNELRSSNHTVGRLAVFMPLTVSANTLYAIATPSLLKQHENSMSNALFSQQRSTDIINTTTKKYG